MKKALKVIVKMACMCGAVALLLFEAYDTCIRPKINMIKSETWQDADDDKQGTDRAGEVTWWIWTSSLQQWQM